MNAILALTLIITGVIAIAGLGLLALTTTSIYREDRRLGLLSDPRSPFDALARRVLGAHVSASTARSVLMAERSAPRARGRAMATLGRHDSD